MAKRLIRLFGFPAHDAPGEAEAECALLQLTGIVDAVLSEDVDTIMFGCTRTLRNWSSEGTRGSKTPTHVSMYETEELEKNGTGLDREGMVLVALMSGGDYLPEGIPGAGVKLACEAARAGFGKSLCRLKKADTSELASWKEYLTFELRHNESGFFRTRHKALCVPDSFPNLEVLRYYTHPVVSPASTLDRLRNQRWDKPVDVQGLREFVRETFDWNYRIGAVKYIRVLAPCLLVRKMMSRTIQPDHQAKAIEIFQREESELVQSITSRRAHFSTDATPELRISFIPTNIVGYAFQEEPDEVIEYGREGLALNSDDEFEALGDEEGTEAVAKSNSKKPFDPTESDLLWIPETVAKLGIPITVEEWEEAQRAKVTARQKPRAVKQATKRKGKSSGADAGASASTGALDKFVKITKNVSKIIDTNKDIASAPNNSLLPSNTKINSPLSVSVVSLSKATPKGRPSKLTTTTATNIKSNSKKGDASRPGPNTSINPWTIASTRRSSRTTRASNTKSNNPASETILISSSPPVSPAARRRSPVNLQTQERPLTEDDNAGSKAVPCSPPPSPHKRRSVTPTGSSAEECEDSPPGRRHAIVRALSPSPKSSEKKPRRKLARTESMPARHNTQESPTTTKRHFARARTVTVEVSLTESGGEEEGGEELPPLSAIIGRLPRGEVKGKGKDVNVLPNNPLVPVSLDTLLLPLSPPPSDRISSQQDPTAEKQKNEKQPNSTLDTSTGKGMTKVYIPRKSEPGFFREVEVPVDEADEFLLRQNTITTSTNSTKARAAGVNGGGRRAPAAWRRSDVECIDLTGVD